MTYNKTHFREWAIPGPIPPGAYGKGPEPEKGESLDAISGHYRIFQLKKGHRYSTDDVLTAWYGTSWAPRAETVLDLGSGIGSVAITAAWRLANARFVTVEAQDESVPLARKSITWNGLDDRFDVRHGDLRDPKILSDDERFDLILGSPPYFPMEAGTGGNHPQKVACRFELRGTVADYCSTAIRHLAPGAIFACVFPVNPQAQEQRVFDGAKAAGLTVIRMRPVVFREGEPPLIGLFAMVRSTDLPPAQQNQTWREPPLIIRCANGDRHPEYAAVAMSFGFPP
jgi:tRNA1(Val) A37 N6-methylase TrmN6